MRKLGHKLQELVRKNEFDYNVMMLKEQDEDILLEEWDNLDGVSMIAIDGKSYDEHELLQALLELGHDIAI